MNKNRRNKIHYGRKIALFVAGQTPCKFVKFQKYCNDQILYSNFVYVSCENVSVITATQYISACQLTPRDLSWYVYWFDRSICRELPFFTLSLGRILLAANIETLNEGLAYYATGNADNTKSLSSKTTDTTTTTSISDTTMSIFKRI